MNLDKFIHLSNIRNIVRFFPKNDNDIEIIVRYYGEDALKKAYIIDRYDDIDKSIIYVIPTGIYDSDYDMIVFCRNKQVSQSDDIARMIEILEEST